MRFAACRGTRAVLAGTGVIALLSVAACSSPAKPPVTPSGPPPSAAASAAAPAATPTAAAAGPTTGSCSVITQAQAGAALGQTVTSVAVGKAFVEGGRACVYYGPDAPAGASPDVPVGDTVRVVLITGPDALKFFNDYRGKVSAQPVSGLGDQAYYDGYASLSVLKGDAYVRIAVGTVGNLQPEKELAADALPNM